MKRSVHPMLVTIIFGLICGLSYIPMSMAMNSLVAWQLAFRFPNQSVGATGIWTILYPRHKPGSALAKASLPE